MQFIINFERRHLYAFILLNCLLLGGLIAYATVANGLYHNVGDTFVMGGAGSSGGIIDDTITDTDILANSISGHNGGAGRIDEATLSTVPSATTAISAGNSNACSGDSVCEVTNTLRFAGCGPSSEVIQSSCYSEYHAQNGHKFFGLSTSPAGSPQVICFNSGTNELWIDNDGTIDCA